MLHALQLLYWPATIIIALAYILAYQSRQSTALWGGFVILCIPYLNILAWAVILCGWIYSYYVHLKFRRTMKCALAQFKASQAQRQ